VPVAQCQRTRRRQPINGGKGEVGETDMQAEILIRRFTPVREITIAARDLFWSPIASAPRRK
jgi:hypothetical protein